MNICEQTKIKMLEDAVLSPEEQRHLGFCADCRMTAELVKRMGQLPSVEQDVPAYLDEAILSAASIPLRKPVWKPVIWKIAVPMAAAFAFVAGLLFYQPEQNKNSASRITEIASVKKVPVRIENEIYEESFDDKVFALAIDVGSKMDTFSESMESVESVMDLI